MPDRRRPGAPQIDRPARPTVDQITAAILRGKQPLEARAIAALADTTTSQAAKVLRRMRRHGAVRWIKREDGGPGFALPRITDTTPRR